MKSAMFGLLVAFIAMASFYDAHLNCQFPPLVQTEENPLACWILSNFGLTAMIGAKIIGTLVAVCVMLFVYRLNVKIAMIATVTVALFQGWVLFYLWS